MTPNSPITPIQRGFAPVRRALPTWLAEPVRRVATAALTPVLYSWHSGHLRSSLLGRAVTVRGEPLPWYSYPAIDFLKARDFSQSTVLEFGAGQSTHWWAARAKHVLALEGDANWSRRIADQMPPNVALMLVDQSAPEQCQASVREAIAASGISTFDLCIIDGLWRTEMVSIARAVRAHDGAVLVDDAEGYGITEAMEGSGLLRVDFIGHAPGVVLRRATSLYFSATSPLVAGAIPISVGRFSA